MPSRFSYSARFRRRSIRPRRTDLLERKPVYYIYPGLIRMSGRRAVTIDSNCPASLYGTEHQRVDNLPSVTSCPSSSSPSISTATQHSPDTCAICLEPFRQSKDIIRQLPCNHFFHSKCILTWIYSADRCPLCNESALQRPRSTPLPEPVVTVTDIDLKVDEEAPKHFRFSLSRHSSTPQPASSSTRHSSRIASTRQDSSNGQTPNHSQPRVYSFVLHDRARYTHIVHSKDSSMRSDQFLRSHANS